MNLILAFLILLFSELICATLNVQKILLHPAYFWVIGVLTGMVAMIFFMKEFN